MHHILGIDHAGRESPYSETADRVAYVGGDRIDLPSFPKIAQRQSRSGARSHHKGSFANLRQAEPTEEMDLPFNIIAELLQPSDERVKVVAVVSLDQFPRVLHQHEFGTHRTHKIHALSDKRILWGIAEMIRRFGPRKVRAGRAIEQDG